MDKKTLMNGRKINEINGVQYPYGFVKWLNDVAKCLRVEHGSFQGKLITVNNVHDFIDPEGYLPYFLEGFNPRAAVWEDIKNL